MTTIWQVKLLLEQSIKTNESQFEWSIEDSQERLNYYHKILKEFKTVLSKSLSGNLKNLVYFEIVEMLEHQNDSNCLMLALNLSSPHEIVHNDELEEFVQICEEAIKFIPRAIDNMVESNVNLEEVILSEHASTLPEVIQVKNKVCRSLIDKLRQLNSRDKFPVSLMLPNNSPIELNADSITKSVNSGSQSEKIKEVTGIIGEISDLKHHLIVQQQGRGITINTPSLSVSERIRFYEAARDYSNITLAALPTVKYFAGTQKEVAYEFVEILESSVALDLDSPNE